jgi:hypothetical protein
MPISTGNYRPMLHISEVLGDSLFVPPVSEGINVHCFVGSENSYLVLREE